MQPNVPGTNKQTNKQTNKRSSERRTVGKLNRRPTRACSMRVGNGREGGRGRDSVAGSPRRGPFGGVGSHFAGVFAPYACDQRLRHVMCTCAGRSGLNIPHGSHHTFGTCRTNMHHTRTHTHTVPAHTRTSPLCTPVCLRRCHCDPKAQVCDCVCLQLLHTTLSSPWSCAAGSP